MMARAGRDAKPVQQTEREFTRAVLDLAQTLGWRTAHFHDSRRQVREGFFVGDKDAKGFPDCVFVRGSRLVFAELKVGKNKPTDEQRLWLLELCATNAEAYLWYESDWSEIEQVLSRRAGNA